MTRLKFGLWVEGGLYWPRSTIISPTPAVRTCESCTMLVNGGAGSMRVNAWWHKTRAETGRAAAHSWREKLKELIRRRTCSGADPQAASVAR